MKAKGWKEKMRDSKLWKLAVDEARAQPGL
jgi:hypothetical protein